MSHKQKLSYLIGTLTYFVALSAVAQGSLIFQNLDFEQATVPYVPPGQYGADVTVANGLPGWVAYLGGGQVGTIFHDNVSIGGPGISLHDSTSLSFQPLQGNYSVFLQGSGAGPAYSAAIGQTGQISPTNVALFFWADPRSNLQVTFGGLPITMMKLGSTSGYDILGGDISMFAGQTAELRFTGPANSGGYFDNIFFSNQPIPEPNALGLFGLGAVLLGYSFLRVRKS